MKFRDYEKFKYIVKEYDGNKYVKSYICWDQLLTMIFGQLSNRESLCELIAAIETHARKLYNLRIGKSVTRIHLSLSAFSFC